MRHAEVCRGYRPNAGAVVAHPQRRGLLWCRRAGEDRWQFPQGGLDGGEDAYEGALRELEEETGIAARHVRLRAQTSGWLHYDVANRWGYRGQAQRWFLLELVGDESHVRPAQVRKPEFDAWQWVSYWHPLHAIVDFKREVYRQVLLEFWPAYAELTRRGANGAAGSGLGPVHYGPYA